MALDCHVGSFNISTGGATTTQDITDPGFQPLAVIFWWSGDTGSSDTVVGGDHKRGIGFAVSSSDRRSVTSISEDAQASSDAARRMRTDSCIDIMATASTNDGLADFSTMLATGFRIVIDDQFSAAFRIHYMALGGTDLTNAECGTFDKINGTGNQVVNTGFQGDAIIFAGCRNLGGQFVDADSDFCVGFAQSSSARGVCFGGSNDNAATMKTRSYGYSGECIIAPHSALDNISDRADFVSFNATPSFTINWSEGGSSGWEQFFLLLKGGNYKVGNLLTRTDTNDISETGFGFVPTGALFMSHCLAESTQDTLQNHDQWSFGGFSATDERASIGSFDEDAVADSVVSRAMEHDEVYLNMDNGDAIEGLMDIKSIDGDGFTCVMDDADPSAAFVTYIAFGPAVAAGTGVKNPLLMGRNPLIGPIG